MTSDQERGWLHVLRAYEREIGEGDGICRCAGAGGCSLGCSWAGFGRGGAGARNRGGVSTSAPDEYGVIALLAESGIPMTADALVVDVEQEYGQAYEVLDLVNAERAKEGIRPLVMDRGLLEPR